MEEKLLQIINHYEINHQQRKLEEEVFELQEALIEYTCDFENDFYEQVEQGHKEHITEEIADVMVLLRQFQCLFEIKDEDIHRIMQKKVNRQIERIGD